jgi:hypothetical protein
MKTLKNVLLINALSSGATGLALVLMPGIFAEVFNTSVREPFVGTGLSLIAFAVIVFLESRRDATSITWVRLIIMLDILWVLTSTMIICFQAFEISALGYFMIAAVALWVGLMAALQYAGLKKVSV